MKTVTLSATFDGEQIRLKEDYPLPKDARLLLTVLPDDLERELARACGPEEPEYPDSLIKEINPFYEPR